jgi:hypothetical protein
VVLTYDAAGSEAASGVVPAGPGGREASASDDASDSFVVDAPGQPAIVKTKRPPSMARDLERLRSVLTYRTA